MSSIANASGPPSRRAALARRSAAALRALRWAREHMFQSIPAAAVTVLVSFLLLKGALALLSWGVWHAVWRVPTGADGQPDVTACLDARGVGACWAVIGEKYRLILFGRYPYDEQWRPCVVVGLFLGLYVVSAIRWFWRPILISIWTAALTLIGILMWGGILGLPFVGQDAWGGLPITLILATFGIAAAFPFSVFVALGRRSQRLPGVRWLCIVYVELIRGVPLVTLLFMASVMFPLFVPAELSPDKLVRAQIAIILFTGAYLAEDVRAGLQAVPKGQYEAADALGLGYWKRTILIVLPQALRLVVPPLVNTFIGLVKNTSLVLIIGTFDLLGISRVATTELLWQAYSVEVYLFIATIYFVLCSAMARYSRGLEEARIARARS